MRESLRRPCHRKSCARRRRVEAVSLNSSDVTATKAISGTFYRGTLHFTHIPAGTAAFQYSCADYSTVALED